MYYCKYLLIYLLFYPVADSLEIHDLIGYKQAIAMMGQSMVFRANACFCAY